MSGEDTQDALHEFCERWGSPVFTFCHLYLGDETFAANATADAFLAYMRRGLALEDDRLPIGLLRLAVESVQRFEVVISDDSELPEFADWVLALPSEERAVFLLHGVFALQFPWITTVIGRSYEQVCQIWDRSLIRIGGHLAAFRDASGDEPRPNATGYSGHPHPMTGAAQC